MFLTFAHASAALAPRKEPRYPVTKRLGGQQSRSGPQSPFVTCVELTANRNYFPMRYELMGFSRRNGECLLRGTIETCNDVLCSLVVMLIGLSFM